MAKSQKLRGILILLALFALISGCSVNSKSAPGNNQVAPTPNQPSTVNEQPVAPEKNPVGDIPDSQVFITYASPSGGYELKVPEGWARTEKGTDVSFIDKFDGVQVLITQAAAQPTAESAKTTQAADLQKTGKAVQITSIKDVTTAGGPAVLMAYSSNSDPDSVTGKKVRLENNDYLFYKNGKLATLRLWAPLGADNVDQWKLMSDSFRWK